MNYEIETLLLVSSSVQSKQQLIILCTHQGQKSEQKHTFHTHFSLMGNKVLDLHHQFENVTFLGQFVKE